MSNSEPTSQTVDWGDESIKSGGDRGPLEKFHLADNETARFVVLDESAFLAMTHYSKEVRRYVRCIRDQVENCPGCSQLGDPRQRFGANVIQYKTKNDGEIIKPIEFTLKLWTFGPDKFAQLRQIKSEWGDLRQRDLKAFCKSKQFQDLVITVTQGTYWLEDDELKLSVSETYKNNKYDVEKIIGKSLTVDQMKDTLAGNDSDSEPQGPSPQVVEQAVQEIEQSLQKEADSPSEAEVTAPVNFDELLADL